MSDRVKTLFSNIEVAVLKDLKEKKFSGNTPFTREIGELASSTGVSDNEEVLRALYTLEGRNLVRPFPQGDFTSNSWEITETGIRALELISN